MACKTVCKLCDSLIISQSVSYASGVLTINIPAGQYATGSKYCIVVAQAIPTDAIVGAPVVITIGSGSVTYPLVDCNGIQLTAAKVHSRTRYSTTVATTAAGGSFKLIGRACLCATTGDGVIDGTAATVTETGVNA